MFINKLRLVNFKGIEDETFLNWKRINGIFGRNGSNKSSILQAIQLVVLAQTPKKIKFEDYIGDYDKKFEIECGFSHLGVEYDFAMKYDKNGSTKVLKADIFEDGILDGVTPVNVHLNSLFDPVLTLNSAFSMQNQTANILEQNPAERLEQLKKILLDKEMLDNIETEIDADLSKKNNEKMGLEKEIEVLDEKTFTYEKETLFVDNRLDLNKDLDAIKADKDSYQTRLNAYNTKMTDYNNAVKAHQTSTTSWDVKQKEIDDKHQQEMTSYNNYQLVLQSYTQYESSLIAHQKTEKELSDKIAQSPLQRLPICKHTQDQINVLNDVVSTAKGDLSQFNRDLELAEAGKCDKCGADYSSVDPEPIKDKIDLVQTDIDNKNAEVSAIQIEMSQHTELVNSITTNNTQTNALKEQLSNLIAPTKVEKPVEVNEPAKQMQESKPVFNLTTPEQPPVVDYSEKISTIEKSISTIEHIIDKNKEVQERNDKVKVEEAEHKKTLEKKNTRLNKLELEVSDYRKAKVIIRKDLPVYVINKGIKFIKLKTNKVFSETYDRYVIDILPSKKGDAIDIYFHNGQRHLNVSLASGAEKQIIASAFRIALCNLQDTGLFIADEVDSDADEERSFNLITTLCKQEDFEQIIIITHNNSTKEVVADMGDSSIFVMDEGKLVS